MTPTPDRDPPQDDAARRDALDNTYDEALSEMTLEQQLEHAEANLQEANDRALRAQAEFENFRKRVRRDMEEERRYAAVPLIRDLLSVVDNLERAVQAASQNETTTGLLEGVKMVTLQFNGVLEQHNCKRIEADGAPFDPHLHEAIGQEQTNQHPPGTVTRVLRVGYQLHDRVIRPAQVMVAVPPGS